MSGAVHAVILGGDAGAYSLARAFHAAFGVTSTVVSIVPTRPIRGSRIIRNVIEPALDDPDVMVATIRRLASEHSEPVIAVTCTDWYVRALVEQRDRLSDVVVVPYTAVEHLDAVMDKWRFSQLCHELGVPHPRTVVRHGGDEVGDLDLTFPVIAKPGDNIAWHHTAFVGKKKVHRLDTPDQLAWLLATAGEAGYRGVFLVQEFIPGNDAQMRIMTTFSDRDATVRMAWGGHVLLEEHTSGTLGNPAAIVTGPLPQIEADARRIVEHLGWVGFANFDVKVDPRDGRGYFFELNPRTGRSNAYLTGSGINPAALWVAAFCGIGEVGEPRPRPVLYRIVPRSLLWWYGDAAARRQLVATRRSINPLRYRGDVSGVRDLWVLFAELRQWVRFSRLYPRSQHRAAAA